MGMGNVSENKILLNHEKKKVCMTSILPSKRHILILENELQSSSKQILLYLESQTSVLIST